MIYPADDVTFPIYFSDMATLSPAAVIRETPEKSFVHVDRLPGSSTAARKAASRAAKDCLLLPVRRGLYYRGLRTRYGVVAPRPDEIARAVLGTRGVGPAGYSAARAWGVTTQVPPVWHVATLRTVEPLDGVVQHSRRNLARADLNEKEIALLELLRAPEVYVEAVWATFVAKVRAAISSGEISAARLRETVPGEYNRAVRDNFARLELDGALGADGYDWSMSTTARPTYRPLSGPTGRRVVEHRQELLDVLRRHGVTNAEIFGSVARGDDRDGSDLDLLVDLAPGTDLFDMVRIKRELEEVLGAPVDLIPRVGLKERVRTAASTDLRPL
ncbi:Predicted nucleotidyltransferase [Pseudonocardia ammonioxydans]|uniref:Predicted nucleotidyltransferase n=2 Tax=Pseudonocardia ammonioxydans TaxID=260086 RepID=A0A1I5FIW3_PSUAM|nr:Predicted nucleotidyltransferase [Pseudonocardia ammonioxydans]